VLKIREARRRITDETFISILNRYAFLGGREAGGFLLLFVDFFPFQIEVPPPADPCKFFWVKAPAIPDMRLATKIGMIQCVKRLPAPLDNELREEKAPAIPFKAVSGPNDDNSPLMDMREAKALGCTICSITSVDRIRIQSEATCIFD